MASGIALGSTSQTSQGGQKTNTWRRGRPSARPYPFLQTAVIAMQRHFWSARRKGRGKCGAARIFIRDGRLRGRRAVRSFHGRRPYAAREVLHTFGVRCVWTSRVVKASSGIVATTETVARPSLFPVGTGSSSTAPFVRWKEKNRTSSKIFLARTGDAGARYPGIEINRIHTLHQHLEGCPERTRSTSARTSESWSYYGL